MLEKNELEACIPEKLPSFKSERKNSNIIQNTKKPIKVMILIKNSRVLPITHKAAYSQGKRG